MGQASHLVRFGPFELRTDTRELSRDGTCIRLQAKPFQVLQSLLDRPGELVKREELRNKLWPSGTFVDFESGLNTAINRLRASLGDSAEEPHYIETLPRLGYRLVCAVESRLHEDGREAVRVTEALVTDPPTAALDLVPAESEPTVVSLKPRRQGPWYLIASIALGILLLLGFLRVRDLRPASGQFRPVSVRGTALLSAHFLAGSKVVYSARLNNKRQSFVANLDGSESRLLPITGSIAAASPAGDLAVIYRDSSPHLSQTSLSNGRTSRISDNVSDADWAPDGKTLALVRENGSDSSVEFPLGHVLFHSQGWITCLRVSRSGTEVAFWEHPVRDDDGGHVRIVGVNGATRMLTDGWSSGDGLAWSPSGREIWFTASRGGQSRALYTTSLSGRIRKLSTQPSSLRLLDVARDGRVLLATDDTRMILRTAMCGKEQDISEFDFSHVDDITQDGNKLLFTEGGDVGGRHYGAYVYDRVSSKATRFGSGRALAISPDGRQALTIDPQDRSSLTITSLESGEMTEVSGRGFRYQWAKFWKHGHLLVGGAFPGQPLMTGDQEVASGRVLPLPGAPYFENAVISPNGVKVAGLVGSFAEVYDAVEKDAHGVLPALHAMPVVWSADSKKLYLLTSNHSNYPILELDLATGRSASWMTIAPPESAVFAGLTGIAYAPQSGAYAYSASLELSRLFVVDGLS